jgi:hypothetical protein
MTTTSPTTGPDEACYEIVISRARPGARRDEILALSQKIEAWASAQPGFLRRTLVEDGAQATWIDLVVWRSREDATRAAAAFAEAPCAADAGRLLDLGTMALYHGAAIPPG